MSRQLHQDPGSKFYRIQLTEDDEKVATNVSPLFLAYLQNKIEAYASAVVNASLPYDPDPTRQVRAIIEHERLKNFVSAYEELFAELANQPTSTN